MPDDPSGASAASVASAASSSPSNLGVDTFLREIISQVLPKGEISSAFSNRLVEYGVGSVRALACMSQQAKQGFLNEVKDKEPFKDLSPGVGSTYLDSLVKEAEAQLEYASHIEPSAPGSLGPFQLLPSARRSRTKDFSESVRRIGKKFGPIPHECMPSQKLIECLRGSPWTYVDISKFFHKDSFSGRRDGTVLAEREDGTPVVIRAPSKSTDNATVRQFGSHWVLAFLSLGWAMLIVQDDASQGQAHSSDLAWIDITAHVCRILSLSIQFNWFAASAVDQAIRQKIEASESMGLGSLSDFYSKSDLVSEVILSALTAYSFSDHPSRFDKKRGRATGNDTVGPNRDSKKASPSKPNNGPERSGRDIGRGPLANTHL